MNDTVNQGQAEPATDPLAIPEFLKRTSKVQDEKLVEVKTDEAKVEDVK